MRFNNILIYQFCILWYHSKLSQSKIQQTFWFTSITFAHFPTLFNIFFFFFKIPLKPWLCACGGSGREGRIVLTVQHAGRAYIGPDLQGVGANFSHLCGHTAPGGVLGWLLHLSGALGICWVGVSRFYPPPLVCAVVKHPNDNDCWHPSRSPGW